MGCARDRRRPAAAQIRFGSKQQIGEGFANQQAEPDEISYTPQAGFVGTEFQHIAHADASYFVEVPHQSKFQFAGTGLLPHANEFVGDGLASGNAGLGTTSKKFFDGVERGVVHALAEGDAESVGGGSELERDHLKSLQNRERDGAEGHGRSRFEGQCDRAPPLQTQGSGDLLRCGEAEFFEPLANLSGTSSLLRLQSGDNLLMSQPATRDHE